MSNIDIIDGFAKDILNHYKSYSHWKYVELDKSKRSLLSIWREESLACHTLKEVLNKDFDIFILGLVSIGLSYYLESGYRFKDIPMLNELDNKVCELLNNFHHHDESTIKEWKKTSHNFSKLLEIVKEG